MRCRLTTPLRPGLDRPPGPRLLEECVTGRAAGLGDPGLWREARQQLEKQRHAGALVEDVAGEHQVERAPLDELVRIGPVDRRRLELDAVRLGVACDQTQRIDIAVRRDHLRPPARRRDARHRQAAAELDHAPTVQLLPSSSRASATPLRQSTDQ